jgi:pimeloyl-ACP methyl ester carboxylesterase
MKWIKRGLLGLAAAIAILVVVGLAIRAVVQSHQERLMEIDAHEGIDEQFFARIGATEEWLTIRGRHQGSPVMLMVHGGPGGANGPMAALLVPYEEDYTVVQWDQPGAGKTFRHGGNVLPRDLSLATVVHDGIEVSEYIKARLHSDKIVLLGWSWGTIVGIEMARQRPDLFSVYVGTGQVVSAAANEALAYQRVLDAVRQRGNLQAVRALEAIGPPPYASYEEFATERKWAGVISGESQNPLGLAFILAIAPRYSLLDSVSYIRGLLASQEHFVGSKMNGEAFSVDLAHTATQFNVPIVVIQGAEDDLTPATLAREYVERLDAPSKAYVQIEGAGHGVLVERPQDFLAALDEHVRPLLTATSSHR